MMIYKLSMKFVIIVCLLLVLAASEDNPTPPGWGGNPQFSVKVNEVLNTTAFSFMYYYNWNLKAERYEYGPDAVEQMCKASGYPYYQNKRCNVIYANDHNIYVQFPDDAYCCLCTDKFGAVRYDWLQGASFIGN